LSPQLGKAMEIIFELRKIFFHEHLKPLIEEVDCSRIEK
jgi:hypothetical protein